MRRRMACPIDGPSQHDWGRSVAWSVHAREFREITSPIVGINDGALRKLMMFRTSQNFCDSSSHVCQGDSAKPSPVRHWGRGGADEIR